MATRTESVEVDGPFITNSLDMLLTATHDAHGFALLPEWLIRDDIRSGKLEPVLDAWRVTLPGGDAHVYAACLPNRRHSRKVHAFIQHVSTHLSQPA
ncbi:LysR substrate-binding domain-containing protein [Parazoarcus communis]|jgi:DNA-binding transcriptional LysR family regulator|nr:LysR substrate-binding domain-containing protein [Parazoarcus communis]